jgi:hypothetical protein
MPPLTADLLRSFMPSRVLASDPLAKSTVLLGSLLGQPAILTLSRTALPAGLEGLGALVDSLADWQARGENDIYHWGGATPGGASAAGGLEINLVWPATELHIRKVRVWTACHAGTKLLTTRLRPCPLPSTRCRNTGS